MIDAINVTNKRCYLYLVRTIDNKLYCGISYDPVIRFYQHCSGKGAKFFNSSKAHALVYIEACDSKPSALKRERAVKQLPKVLKEQLIMAVTNTYKLPLYNKNKELTLKDILL